MPLEKLPALLAAIPGKLVEAIRDTSDELEVLAVSGMRRSLNAGESPDGTPLKALAFPRPQGGSKPLQNTGLLGASLSASVSETELTLRANAPGARLHQFGGTIVPVRAKALTIPLTVEAVRAGGARNFPRPLFVLKKKDGGPGGALAETVGKGKNASVRVHYLLRMSVTIPARPYLGVSQPTADRMGGVIAGRLEELAMEVR
jgi:phage gpG-like protein